MSKKSKIILIIAIIFVSLISVAAIVMFFISQVTVTHVSSAILTPVEDNISDYSLYEADDEESHEVTVHNDPEAFQYDLSAIELPEDFSFKIAWGYGYSSYYNRAANLSEYLRYSCSKLAVIIPFPIEALISLSLHHLTFSTSSLSGLNIKSPTVANTATSSLSRDDS